MSITFAPTTTAADIIAWEASCFAGGSEAVVVSEPTHAEAVLAASAHKLLCEECAVYGCYVGAEIPGLPELNLANGNAGFILNLLGIPFDYCGSLPAAEFAERLAFATVVGSGDQGTEGITIRYESGATLIDCGRPVGYADRRLAQLAEVVAWAVEHGRDVQWS